MKSTLLLMILPVLMTYIGCGAGKPDGAADGPLLRLSLQPIPAYAPLWVAKRNGWLEESLSTRQQGRVEWMVIRDGPLQNEAFGAGLLDAALMGDTPAIIGHTAGLPTEIIAIASISPTSLAVLVPKESPIQSPQELKGKKVGVTKGSFCHHLLALVLKEHGLSLNDIRFINMSAPEINSSLQTGELDAGVTWEPFLSRLVQNGTARVLEDGTGIKRGDEVIVASKKFADAHPEVINTLLEVYERGAEEIRKNPAEAAKLITDDIKLPPDLLAEIMVKTDYNPAIGQDDVQELEKTQAFLLELGIIRQAVPVEQLIDQDRLKIETALQGQP